MVFKSRDVGNNGSKKIKKTFARNEKTFYVCTPQNKRRSLNIEKQI